MSVVLEVDLTSSVPAFEQIRLQVVAHVAAARLTPGDRLPTIRALATDLGVAAGTVARAYRELEAAGIVTTRRRTGTTIASDVAPLDAPGRRAARLFVDTVRAAGVSDDEALALVRGALLGPDAPSTVDAATRVEPTRQGEATMQGEATTRGEGAPRGDGTASLRA